MWCVCEWNFKRITTKQTNKLKNCMEQSTSLEGNSSSATPQISHILWYTNVYFPVYKSRLPLLILSQISEVHVRHPSFSISILFLSSKLSLDLPISLFLQGLRNKTLSATLLLFIRATFPAHLILLLCISWMILYYQYI